MLRFVFKDYFYIEDSIGAENSNFKYFNMSSGYKDSLWVMRIRLVRCIGSYFLLEDTDIERRDSKKKSRILSLCCILFKIGYGCHFWSGL